MGMRMGLDDFGSDAGEDDDVSGCSMLTDGGSVDDFGLDFTSEVRHQD